jgi:hypothetical protein
VPENACGKVVTEPVLRELTTFIKLLHDRFYVPQSLSVLASMKAAFPGHESGRRTRARGTADAQ